MRLRSVDLPAFGRPTRATTPKRGFWSPRSSVLGPRFEGGRVRGPRTEDRGRLLGIVFLFLPLRPPLRIARDLHSINAPAVRAVHFESIAVLRHHRPGARHAAEHRENEACDRLVVLGSQLRVQSLFELLDAYESTHEIVPIAEIDDRRLLFFVFI